MYEYIYIIKHSFCAYWRARRACTHPQRWWLERYRRACSIDGRETLQRFILTNRSRILEHIIWGREREIDWRSRRGREGRREGSREGMTEEEREMRNGEGREREMDGGRERESVCACVVYTRICAYVNATAWAYLRLCAWENIDWWRSPYVSGQPVNRSALLSVVVCAYV